MTRISVNINLTHDTLREEKMRTNFFTAVYCLFTGSMLSEGGWMGVSRVPGDIVLSSGDLGLVGDCYKGAAIKRSKLARTQS